MGKASDNPSSVSEKSSKGPDNQLVVKYDDPDTKVVIRLLPPNLTEEAFLLQLPCEAHPFEGGKSLLVNYYYQRGSPSTKPFEEPTFSRAYFKFTLKEKANAFRSTMEKIVFEDLDSGDRVRCEMFKPIFGSVVDLTPPKTPGSIIHDPLFVKFLEQFESPTASHDLVAIINSTNAEKARLKREKSRPKANDKDQTSKVKESKGIRPTRAKQSLKSEEKAPKHTDKKKESKKNNVKTKEKINKKSNKHDEAKSKKKSPSKQKKS